MAQKLIGFFSRYLLLWPVLALGLYIAAGNRFIQDDAFIAFRYAKHFAQGLGLIWYPGSQEFGYTNFLYTFGIGVGMLLGLDPERVSFAINLSCFAAALFVTHAIARRIIGHRLLALLPPLLLATHHTFTSYASSGLETMPQTLLLLLFYWNVLSRDERPEGDTHQRLGLIAALALLVRLDSAMWLLPGYAYLWFRARRTWQPREAMRAALGLWQAWLVPLVTVAALLLCCYAVYGQALPNSYYIKMPTDQRSLLQYGLRYLWLYNNLHLYLPFFVPVLTLYFFLRPTNGRHIGEPALLLFFVLLCWLCYVAYVGGDFMEFRFLVPILPFYYIAVLRLVQALVTRVNQWPVYAAAGLFLLGNLTHATLFDTRPNFYDLPDRPKPFGYANVETTEALNDWLTHWPVNWREIGKGLKQTFGPQSGVVVATSAIGAISYYSDMPVFDLLGLNSSEVRGDFDTFLNRPGHDKKASQVLIGRKVHLNLGHPQTLCKIGPHYVYTPSTSYTFYYTRHETLYVPMGHQCYVVADYVNKHPKIEALLAENVILRHRNVAKFSNCPQWLCLK